MTDTTMTSPVPAKRRKRLFILAGVGVFLVGAIGGFLLWATSGGTPDWVIERRTQILGSPLFNDPPPGWTKDFSNGVSSLGDREHIWTTWIAPGRVDDARKTLRETHGAKYIVRQTGPGIERWTQSETQLEIQVSYTSSGARTTVQVDLNVPWTALRPR